MEFITLDDISDNVLTCREADIEYANDYLYRKAKSFGLADGEIKLPCTATIKQLGTAVACRECAIAMVGSDTTVMVDGSRSDDIYLQKYKIYKDLASSIEGSLSYSDFAIEDTDVAGKGGVGVIRLSRA